MTHLICFVTPSNPPQIRLRGAVASGLNIFDDAAEESTDNLVYIATGEEPHIMCGPCAISEGAPSQLHCPDVADKVCEGVWRNQNSHSCVECPDTGCPNGCVPPSPPSQEWDFKVVDKF